MVEQLAALALRNCEDAGAALAARPPGSDEAKQQAGHWAALRLITHELLVVVCARPLPIEALHAKGITPSLKKRLNAALGFELSLKEHQDVSSRVGKAKWHMFTPEKVGRQEEEGASSRDRLEQPHGGTCLEQRHGGTCSFNASCSGRHGFGLQRMGLGRRRGRGGGQRS